jgi:hypothetical protein
MAHDVWSVLMSQTDPLSFACQHTNSTRGLLKLRVFTRSEITNWSRRILFHGIHTVHSFSLFNAGALSKRAWPLTVRKLFHLLYPLFLLCNPCTALDRPWCFQEVEYPRFEDRRHMKVVSLSPLHTDHLYPQEIFLVLISVGGWVDPTVILRLQGLWQRKFAIIPTGQHRLYIGKSYIVKIQFNLGRCYGDCYFVIVKRYL